MAAIAFEQVGKVYPDGTQAVCSLDLDVPDEPSPEAAGRGTKPGP